MVDETLHGVSIAIQEQLVRGTLGQHENWREFHRLNRRTTEILRSTGMTFKRPTRRPFGLQADLPQKNALQLLSLYRTVGNQGIIPEPFFRFSHRKLGLKEAVRYLRGLYEKGAVQELELEFGFVLAQLSYLTLPTWRTAGMGLSFLWRMGWDELKEAASSPAKVLPILNKAEARPLEASFSSGIYLEPSGVRRIERVLREEGRQKLIRMAVAKQIPASEFEPALNMIAEAVYFAGEFGCGLIEATGILDEDSMITPV